ncbi:hypothetical protein [Pseudomonas sp. NPDC007930]|uniref:hypothetical protein n=1 Tax=Pseudomonas sp. NPDC007930 TaxID=3364417 RepID=UPI0036E63834
MKARQHGQIVEELRQRLARRESLFLPMTTILETGNHIGQNGDGRARRACATRFVDQVSQAMNGTSPFKPISFLTPEEMAKWLHAFPAPANGGSGLGDLSIIHDWERLCAQNKGRRVYIWSLDVHLSGYDQAPAL